MGTMKTLVKYLMLKHKKLTIVAGIVLLMVIAGIPAYYFYAQYRKTLSYMSDPTLRDKEKTQEIVTKVGNLMVLPEGEDPTIATVSDKEKLKDQPFFAKSKNGDKVLIYTNAKKAILYDPVAHKIVEVASINPPTNQGTPSAETAQSPSPISIILYNGAGKTGLTLSYEEQLKTKVPNAEVTDRKNARSTNYQETIIVDLTGVKSKEAAALAQTLGIKTATLPDGETKPEGADFLIIVGADQQ